MSNKKPTQEDCLKQYAGMLVFFSKMIHRYADNLKMHAESLLDMCEDTDRREFNEGETMHNLEKSLYHIQYYRKKASDSYYMYDDERNDKSD